MPNKNAYLKAMGIDVWVEKTPAIPEAINSKEEQAAVISPVETMNTAVESSVQSAPSKEESIQSPVEVVKDIDITTLDWPALQAQVSNCQLCELAKSGKQKTFASGNQTADLMIVADDSDQQSSQLLTSMLKAMGCQRSDVYITNIVKCQVEENNEVSDEQSTSCEPYLFRQISLLKPKLILALGNAAAQRLLKSKSTMNRLRGQLHYVDGINSPILVSYHPTYLLAAPNEKRKAWQDLQLAMKELRL